MKPTDLPLILHNWGPNGRDGVPQTLPAGDCIKLIAGAILNVGEYVYISAANTAGKSAVAATVAASPIGVVLSGSSLNDTYPDSYTPAGVPSYVAAQVGGTVIVQYDGLALVYCTGALAVGGTVIPGGVAGQVVAGSTATQILGYNVGAALAGAGWALIKLEHR
jgi:hypothetical protein